MARIRTVKPDFFRHEGLQDLEELHPRIMLFFAGLWCQCDKAGHFRWKPKQIKLDVLPFIEYSPSTYLEVLKDNGYLSQYSVEGEDYGKILNFKKHQLIWGSESQAPVRWPDSEKEVLKYVQSTPEDNGVRSQETGVRKQESGRGRFTPPTIMDVSEYCTERKSKINPQKFLSHYEANGWVQGKGKPIKDWKAAVRTWEQNDFQSTNAQKPDNRPRYPSPAEVQAQRGF